MLLLWVDRKRSKPSAKCPSSYGSLLRKETRPAFYKSLDTLKNPCRPPNGITRLTSTSIQNWSKPGTNTWVINGAFPLGFSVNQEKTAAPHGGSTATRTFPLPLTPTPLAPAGPSSRDTPPASSRLFATGRNGIRTRVGSGRSHSRRSMLRLSFRIPIRRLSLSRRSDV